MINSFKNITLKVKQRTNSGHFVSTPTKSGMRNRLSWDTRYTPVVPSKNMVSGDPVTWDSITNIQSAVAADVKACVGVLGETFGVEDVPTQIVETGVVQIPVSALKAPTGAATVTWKPGCILILSLNSVSKSIIIDKVDPEGVEDISDKADLQVGVLMEPVEWTYAASRFTPTKSSVEVLVGFNKIARKLVPLAE